MIQMGTARATALSALLFAVSGCWSSYWWVMKTESWQWHVPLQFAIPLVLLCRCRNGLLSQLWLAASCFIWSAVLSAGEWLFLLLRESGIAVTGGLGALLLAGAFWILVRRPAALEVIWLSFAGLIGGIVLGATGEQVSTGQSEFHATFLGTRTGFAVWQILVGSLLVWMSLRIASSQRTGMSESAKDLMVIRVFDMAGNAGLAKIVVR
jgi:hypothetical protein